MYEFHNSELNAVGARLISQLQIVENPNSTWIANLVFKTIYSKSLRTYHI